MMPHDWLGLAAGAVVGLSLGLTGGGGSIFAVPLLVYMLGLEPRLAIGLSLVVVGLTAGFGAALRWREVSLQPGLIFALGGMACAPFGAWLGAKIPPAILLSIFALLMGFVGWRMWLGKSDEAVRPGPCVPSDGARPGWSCWWRLMTAGVAAGLLSGLFGVGGGFIIVPALLYVTGATMHRAVATSLLVIFLIALSGVAASLRHGASYPMPEAMLFPIGGMLGMMAGSQLRSRLNEAALRRVFAVGMWGVAVFMLAKNAPSLR